MAGAPPPIATTTPVVSFHQGMSHQREPRKRWDSPADVALGDGSIGLLTRRSPGSEIEAGGPNDDHDNHLGHSLGRRRETLALMAVPIAIGSYGTAVQLVGKLDNRGVMRLNCCTCKREPVLLSTKFHRRRFLDTLWSVVLHLDMPPAPPPIPTVHAHAPNIRAMHPRRALHYCNCLPSGAIQNRLSVLARLVRFGE